MTAPAATSWGQWATTISTLIAAHAGTSREARGWQILKVAEEAGEVAAAWIGYVGQNPRKGVTHTLDDVIAELADVAATAFVAMATLGHNPDEVMAAFIQRMVSSGRLATYEAAAQRAGAR